MSLAAPRAPAGSFDAASASRGKGLFEGKADCARCHAPPLYTEPGWNMHRPVEIGIDSFQADRSPDGHYRTAPLKGLWTDSKGGYYHDRRFPTLAAVITHYLAIEQPLRQVDSSVFRILESLEPVCRRRGSEAVPHHHHGDCQRREST